MRLGYEQDQDVGVRWHDKAELVQVANEEVIEALHNGLDGLEVESALFVVVAPRWCLDRKVDVLKHREENLAKNLAPELKAEDLDALLQDLEQDFKRFLLVFIGLVECEVCQVSQDGEPETFLDTKEALLIAGLLLQLAFLGLVLFCPESVLWRVVAHVLQVSLVEVLALLGQEEVYQVIVTLEMLGADEEEPLSFLALLVEHGVHAVLVEAVDELDEVVLEQAEFLCHCDLERIERLLHEHLLAILRCKREYVDNHAPA